ncbi:ATP-dependent RNA helicase HrpA [Alkalilimnicola sp. S0819]|uniref:ATP-dependent RNA helicase HrpA n=1 Tax=Alkalilimnicola sp. S0819 TaxID=2613922 RepID=UPI001261C9C1|nr:ATP-dependent RNA helicase HrpA [Alkalilimnicola sp. S0819]KAB7627529.1 ATP-dependent RNA helicase HrpA [Alkalilimnicola sp. S0819]MPQ15683.1 ATP-dependent RNA helicase HrpA [Alkalilimnicola sp. S0819]
MSDKPLAQLEQQLLEAFGADRPALRKRLGGLKRRAARGQPYERGLNSLRADLEHSRETVARRQAHLPTPDYPDELPVSARREDIARAIRDHQVVVVCGETGSGKSTQLPKICLELGRGVRGHIGHTQPRRLAARTLAARISEELGRPLGEAVGYKVRFSDRVGPNTHIKLLTDGMLLAEVQGDRRLDAYDTLIIDEAHERSLNIDFLLGYLKQILPQRPDLKVIITSATIDPERFARHFNDAPILQVSGRGYPVELRYRPPPNDEADQAQAVVSAVDELAREGPGDILVFFSGEREIREAAEALRKHHPKQAEILPLYARLSAAEQQRAFRTGRGRRIVLATNVAETSVTVPGIRYVVDTGYARINRYSFRSKVQRLPVEPISQASANQRAGRCGRLGPGVCIRLYAEDDFLGRPEFTDPEIRRSNLAAVILQMKALGLGDIEAFPFLEPPDQRLINDGFKTLWELGAVDEQRALTERGRQLSRLPVDPRVARMLLQAERNGALEETLVITAALSIQDPRERPLEAQQAADEAHARFRDERSDFLGYLKLWEHLREQARHLSKRKWQQHLRGLFLSPARVREWQEIHRQLRELTHGMGLRANQEPADYRALHQALLSGLVGQIARKDEEGEYEGARGIRLRIFPGSGLAKRKPKWIVASELVETRRLFARDVAEIRPEWVEALAPHLLQRSHFEPHWQARAGRVAAWEQISLYGLVLVEKRKVNYGPLDPAASHEIFLREGLVEERLRTRGRFLAANRALIDEIRALEEKSRRRDVLADEESRYAFYAARVPGHIHDTVSFERWRVQAEQDDPRLLHMRREDLMAHEAEQVTDQAYPSQLTLGPLRLPLAYHFDPAASDDGVTVEVPLAALNQLDPGAFEWLVPGLLEEKLIALIKALPKALRKHFVPAPDYARALMQSLPAGEGSLLEAVRAELRRMSGVDVPIDAWDGVDFPAHLRMNFRVLSPKGKVLAEGRDLRALQRRWGGEAAGAFEPAAASQWQREEVRDWDFDELPESIRFEQQGVSLQAWPALQVQGQGLALTLMDNPARAAQANREGIRRLYQLRLAQQHRYLRRQLPGLDKLGLLYRGLGNSDELRALITETAFERCFELDLGLPRSRAEFLRRLEQGRAELVPVATRLAEQTAQVLEAYQGVRRALRAPQALSQMESLADAREQLDALLPADFALRTPREWWPHLPRYLQALHKRLDKIARDPGRDRPGLRRIRPLWEQYLERRRQHESRGIDDAALRQYRWLLEEFRVSLFAQELGTAVPVSEKRLHQLWKEVQ